MNESPLGPQFREGDLRSTFVLIQVDLSEEVTKHPLLFLLIPGLLADDVSALV